MVKNKPTPTGLTDALRRELCQQKQRHPTLTQGQLQKWLKDTHKVCVTQPTISNTLKRSAELLSMEDTAPNPNQQRRPDVRYPDMEKALKQWIEEYQLVVNLNGNMICAKGAEFLRRLYPTAGEFTFSNGWLEKFKTRHGIRSYRRFGESGAVDMEMIDAALPAIRNVLDQYELKDTYNMDETGLFYRLQADNSLATKQLEGRTQSKERITAVLCCNADGSDKLPLTVIGKSMKPRCFKNINLATLNIRYHANKTAWMTQNIFRLWLRQFDQRMAGRKVLLVMDNCPCHIKLEDFEAMDIHLKNTTVYYLPANSTSKIQPCDAGIIRTFKAYYRQRFNRLLLERIESNTPNAERINILTGIQMAVAAWHDDVKPTTIRNCWKHCGIRTEDATEPTSEAVEVPASVLSTLEEQVARFGYNNPMEIRNLLNYPEEDNCLEVPSDTAITERIVEELRPLEEETAEDDSVEVPMVSGKQMQECYDTLVLWWMQQQDSHPKIIKELQQQKVVAANMVQKGLKQTSITSFFASKS